MTCPAEDVAVAVGWLPHQHQDRLGFSYLLAARNYMVAQLQMGHHWLLWAQVRRNYVFTVAGMANSASAGSCDGMRHACSKSSLFALLLAADQLQEVPWPQSYAAVQAVHPSLKGLDTPAKTGGLLAELPHHELQSA